FVPRGPASAPEDHAARLAEELVSSSKQ
ncbi:MAG: hypothetical protein FD126_2090, partial [Elusimicrobia bacterium]